MSRTGVTHRPDNEGEFDDDDFDVEDSDANAPTYSDAVITFFDILGFGSLVATRTAAEIYSIVANFQNTYDTLTGPYPPDELRSVKRFSLFSDSAVRIAYFDPAVPELASMIVLQEIISCMYIQLMLLRERVYIRGGMAVGGIFFAGTKLFGPGLLEAYNLENKLARYPRIAVSEGALTLAQSGRFGGAFHDGYVTTSSDGVSYIDYLRGASHEYRGFGEYLDLLWEHRGWITELLERTGTPDAVREKYEWMATYHDATIMKFRDVILHRSRMKIHEMLIPPELWNSKSELPV
ncbi:MAG TPA: hypothetical protein VF710_06745 [Longimicrobium sp.]|jgi:hypothetical protein